MSAQNLASNFYVRFGRNPRQANFAVKAAFTPCKPKFRLVKSRLIFYFFTHHQHHADTYAKRQNRAAAVAQKRYRDAFNGRDRGDAIGVHQKRKRYKKPDAKLKSPRNFPPQKFHRIKF